MFKNKLFFMILLLLLWIPLSLLLLMLFNMSSDVCCDQSTKLESYEEGSVSFSCPYDSKYRNSLKYICRGNQTSTCLEQAVITSDSQQNGQFRLTDDNLRKFTVTLTSLTQRDSGWYLCGVQQTGLDVFSSVKLEVKGERLYSFTWPYSSKALLFTAAFL